MAKNEQAEFDRLMKLGDKELAAELSTVLEGNYFFRNGALHKEVFQRYLDTEIMESKGIRTVDKVSTVKWAAEVICDPSALYF